MRSYEHIVFDGEHVSFASLPGMAERTVTVNGLSKAFALTGWRVGYIGAPEWIAKACTRLQGQSTSGTNSIAQRVTCPACRRTPPCWPRCGRTSRRRRELVPKALEQVPGWHCNRPQGAFYVLPDASTAIDGDRIADSEALAMHLLEHAGVSVVAGMPSGALGTVRLSHATSDDLIAKAVERIAEAMHKLGH